MSSYDLPRTQEEMRSTFALVRLQIVSPLSLLVSIGANLVCYFLITPSMVDVSRAHPTLVSPLTLFIGGYWLVVYALQIGLCFILVLTRGENTKDLLIRGVGIRFSIANWLMAGWAVLWTMQFTWSFLAAEVLLLLNVLNLLTIYITLARHYHAHNVLDWVFIHVPMRLMLIILFSIDWLDNGFIVLGWEARDSARYARYTWQAVGAIAGVNAVGVLVTFFMRDIVWAVAGPYLLVSLMLKRPKPFPVIVTIIVFLVLYPFFYLLALALHRSKTREGRIRLEEEAIASSHDYPAHAAPAAVAPVQPGRLPQSAPPAGGASAA